MTDNSIFKRFHQLLDQIDEELNALLGGTEDVNERANLASEIELILIGNLETYRNIKAIIDQDADQHGTM